MARCPECGKNVEKGARYCSHCGEAIDPTTLVDRLTSKPILGTATVSIGVIVLVCLLITGVLAIGVLPDETGQQPSDIGNGNGEAADLEGAASQSPTAAPTASPSMETSTVSATATASPTATATATATETPTPEGPKTAWTVTVVSVTDGDTMDVRMPDGSVETIRLLGVDTPETSVTQVSPDEWEDIPATTDGRDWLANWGHEASTYAESRLSGKEIYIETDSEADRRGYYGRLLVYAYQSRTSETSFNMRLLDNGYARYYSSTFSKQSNYQSAESEARAADTAVWDYTAPSTPIPSSDGSADLVVQEVHADAEGNDHENLNDEYITFKNQGETAVDMGSWTLSDEADHTYYFPSGFSLGVGATVTVYTGRGSDSESALYWGSERAIWNNGGDKIIVKNSSGEIVVEYEYNG